MSSKHPKKLDQQVLDFKLKGVDPECKTVPEDVANACGIHIHEGKSCKENALGHYWNKGEIEADPWAPVTYKITSMKGDVAYGEVVDKQVITGLTGDQVKGHTMIIHDHTGGRIACGIVGQNGVNIHTLFDVDPDLALETTWHKSIPAVAALVCGLFLVTFAIVRLRRHGATEATAEHSMSTEEIE
jgi:hypothetical protein